MRSTPLPLAIALSAALGAQTAVMRVLMDRDEVDAPALLCIVDAPGSRALSEGFTALLQREELKAFQVPVKVFRLGSGAERDFLARHFLEAKAQWTLIDRKGSKLLAQGETLPSIPAFAQDLEQAGFRDRGKELRAYLKENPRSLEAHDQMLTLLRRRGEATAQRLMGVQVPSRKVGLQGGDLGGYLGALDAPAQADLSQAAPLDPTQDLEAWGAFVQELDTVFRSGQWQELDMAWLREARFLDEASPSLKGLYQRWQPAVEAALQDAPQSEPLWSLWLWMSQARGGRPLRPLLASLRPSPLAPAAEWPPAKVLRALFATAHTPEDWRALEDHFRARWITEPHTLRDAPPVDGAPDASHAGLLEQDWKANLEPLLEACLRCGDTQRADLLLIEALDASHWTALAAKASAVAGRCGQPRLAVRWAALRPGGPRL
ncbi:MAG TPA: hypothetical protein VJ483_02270 [Holophagaceae bacterium]|nr:hypothetical protein [Holophagaceae bacterium]